MIEDAELLRRYAEDRSEGAFAELVKRRVGLVYSVAVRQCGGDVHLAEDVTQKVFTDLARKAAVLAERPVLSGWLYRSAQFAASDVVRSERRRRAREEENQSMNEISTGGSGADGGQGAVDWEKLRPVLDAAMGELGDEDRDAVALRFFEGKSFGEIGGRLALSEEAARKRVSLGVGKLQGLLARRGVTSTEAALGLALANQAAAVVPAGFAASVTSGALAGAGLAGAAVAGGGLAIFMGTTKLTVGLLGAAAVAGIGAAWWGTSRAQEAQAALATATQEQVLLSAKQEKLETQVQAQTKRLQTAETENARLLAVAEKMRAAAAAPAAEAEPVTSGMVITRWRRAQQLAKDGDPAEALKEVLWCYDVGMVQISSMSAVRMSSGISTLATLGGRYPAALEALRERRDKARERMMADESDYAAVSGFGSSNRYLKDDAANMALYDQLPDGDQRKRTLAASSYEYLVQNQRYKDAIEGRSYSNISSHFESMLQVRPAAGLPNPEQIEKRQRESLVTSTARSIEAFEKRQRESLVTSTARSIEALAGVGQLANARTLAQRLLAYDNTETTKALIQKHAERAGRPGLLTESAPNP
jgi:RNA polymerase sigma factor (sigma-70 family)